MTFGPVAFVAQLIESLVCDSVPAIRVLPDFPTARSVGRFARNRVSMADYLVILCPRLEPGQYRPSNPFRAADEQLQIIAVGLVRVFRVWKLERLFFCGTGRADLAIFYSLFLLPA